MEIFDGSPIALKGARIIDGTGAAPITAGTVLFRDGRIVATGRTEEVPVPSEARIYELAGKTVMPGMIDTHTHIQLFRGDGEMDRLRDTIPAKTLKAAENARRNLLAGFTTIRDLGAEDLVDLAVRDACEAGLLEGPRMQVSGYKIAPTGADFPIFPDHVAVSGRPVMDSPDEVRKAVRTLLALGVDVIKVMTSGRTFRKSSSPDAYALSLEETRVAVEEAHNQGVPVSCHAHGALGVKIALAAGCDSLEHGTVLDDEDISLMIEKGIFLIPTLSYGKKVEELGHHSGLPAYSVEKAIRSRRERLKSFRKALEAGVTVAMGSDAGMPFAWHGENAFELEAMVEAGMSPSQALVSVTSTAARVLGLDGEIGLLARGKKADILVVADDPLEDISVLQREEKILAVFKEGRPVVDRGLSS